MANKLGDFLISLAILAFLFASMTALFLSFDDSLNVKSSLTTDLQGLNNNLSGVANLEAEFVASIDNTSVLALDSDDDVDTRGTDSLSLMNLLSKNVLVNWIKSVGDKLNVPSVVSALVLSLIGLIITILLVRSFLGEGRI